MAGTTVSRKNSASPYGGLAQLKASFNLLVDDIENLRRQVSYMMPGVVLTAPGSVAGTTDAKRWRTAAYTFTFRGLIVSSAAQEKALTGTTHDVGASKEAWFVLSVQSNGTSYTVTKAADQTIGTVLLPTGPDNEIIVGYMKITTGVTGYVANTDNLTADGLKIATLSWTDAPAMGAAGLTAYKLTDIS